jgi:hypothetical protein
MRPDNCTIASKCFVCFRSGAECLAQPAPDSPSRLSGNGPDGNKLSGIIRATSSLPLETSTFKCFYEELRKTYANSSNDLRISG